LRNGKVEPLDLSKIEEDTGSSWLSSPSGLHPAKGQTSPAPGKQGAYSWVKAPRYAGKVVEVGPLARTMITHLSGANPALSSLLTGALSHLDLTASAMSSVMGRHLARAIETRLIAERCAVWLDALDPGRSGMSPSYQIPESGHGVGLVEAPRGALGHWIDIAQKTISHYECVVPTTWNCSPRDDRGQPGALEQALVGITLADQANPIEAMRVVRSFDPCLACAVH
jgi:Ni,Fe-hydrogenase I large subunit